MAGHYRGSAGPDLNPHGTHGDQRRRRGANIARTREIWPCADGFVSFGIRGGKARLNTWATVTDLVAADGIESSALEACDWTTFNHNNADQADLDSDGALLQLDFQLIFILFRFYPFA